MTVSKLLSYILTFSYVICQISPEHGALISSSLSVIPVSNIAHSNEETRDVGTAEKGKNRSRRSS